MAKFMRVFLSMTVAFIAFIFAFLAVFIPMLISAMHDAPHDGQAGMGAFFVGLPLGALAALIAGPTYYVQAKRRKWFPDSH